MKKSAIIVDIEWDPDSPMESPSVLQLAAVKINHNNDEVDTFFSFIKPRFEISDISKILTIMPITSDDIFSGKYITIILSEFIKWCGPECSFVMWGSYNLKVFSRIMEEYIPANQDHTLDLQQVYAIISDSNYLNLEKACINSGIKVFYPLHNSLNDSRSLTELYKTLAQKYDLEDILQKHLNEKTERRSEKRKEKRKQQSQKKVMYSYQYILDLCSGAVHQKRCSALQAGLPQSKGFDTLKGALKEGRVVCPICFGENISFDHDFTVNEKVQLINLHNLCANLNIKSKNQARQFAMSTDVGRWYFMFSEGVPALYHHNNIYPDKNTTGVHDYHKQPVKFTSYQDMILYICSHDQKVKSPYHWNKLIDFGV